MFAHLSQFVGQVGDLSYEALPLGCSLQYAVPCTVMAKTHHLPPLLPRRRKIMKTRTSVVVGMILIAALARLIPHWPNFTPVAALALFGAAHLRSRWASLLVPMTALLLSDAALEVTTRL